MTEAEVLELLRGAVATVLEVDPLTVGPTTRFVADLAADSLALVEIVEIVEEDLTRTRPSFRIADQDLDGLTTVGDAVSYVLARLQ